MEGQRDGVAAAPPPVRDRRRALLADAALLSVAVVWGLNFVVIKDAIADTGPMTYLLWRHIVAAILLAAVMPRTARQTTRRDWLYGAVLGSFLFVAFVTQTIGLQWTTPGKSGFITSLYIVMVPFLYWIVARRSPGWTQIGGAVLATVGLGLLSFQGGLGMSKGDLLTLVGALGFAAQIAATGFFAPQTKPAVLALTQIVAAAVLFVVVTPFTEHITWDFGWQALGGHRLDRALRHGVRLPDPGVGAEVDDLDAGGRDPRPRGPLRGRVRAALRHGRAELAVRGRRGADPRRRDRHRDAARPARRAEPGGRAAARGLTAPQAHRRRPRRRCARH